MAETITGRMARLGFVSYRDHEAIGTPEGRRRMVCEYESLDRLMKEPVVDILIIDEARAVMKAVTTYEMNIDQLIPNYEMLIQLARRCGKLIVMCADLNLDLAVETFINDVLRVGGQQLLPPPTGFRIRHPPREKIDRVLWVKGLHGRNGGQVKAKFPNIRIRAYGADSPHKAELGDIETYWAEFDVIFYTSKEAEVAKIMASRDAKTPMIVQMRNRYLEDDSSDTIKHLPDNMTKIWACNLADDTLKAKVWYPLFLWMVRKKGYKYRRVSPEEEAEARVVESEEDDKESDDGPLEQFQVFSAFDMKEAEKKMMADIDVMSFTQSEEKHLLAREIQGVAQQEDIIALKKYSVQKLFREELAVDEIYTVLRKKRAMHERVQLP
eukprot:g21063.t1